MIGDPRTDLIAFALVVGLIPDPTPARLRFYRRMLRRITKGQPR